MIKTTRFLIGVFAIGLAVMVASCNDDGDIGDTGSVPVSDGFYVAKEDETPGTSDALVAEKVEADGFSSQDRDGYFANYVYLTAGNYNIVNVIDQEIAEVYGGTAADVTEDGSDCALNTIKLVDEYVVDGAAINIASAGLYKVVVDVDTKEIWFMKIEKAHVIGGATTAGWSNSDDYELDVQAGASADGITYKATNLVMKKGDWKVRFDCRWTVDRRVDSGAGFDADNGYVSFINFGGTPAALAAGGSNLVIPFGQDGKYTIELKWTPEDGFTLTTTNTEPVAPKAPGTYAWGIIGSATPITDWSADTDLPIVGTPTATAATYEIASIALTEGGEFKIRAEDAWGIVLKPSGTDILGTVTGDGVANLESTGGGDPNWRVKVGGAGNYKVTVSTTNTGEKWNIVFDKLP